MLCSALTALVIMINLALAQDATAEGMISEEGRKHTSHLAAKLILEKENYSLAGDDRKMMKRFKIKDLELIKVKLENVVGKYDWKEEKLRDLYGGVAASCGLDNCKKFRGFPEVQKFKKFHCKKTVKPHGLKKRTLKFLLDFHKGVENYIEIFQEVIDFEKWPPFEEVGISNESRLQILNELQSDVKTLIEEIVEIDRSKENKRLKFSREPRKSQRAPIQVPKSQTNLMIVEWRIIQQSKEFFKNWSKKFGTVYRCWKARKPKWNLHKNYYKTSLKKH